MNNYLLLRNNKETGPFSFDELVKQGLKQYDLVWVDGKSAAWRYPCEISELKQYAPEVTEQPFDRFFKKQDKSSIVTNNNTGAAIQEPPVIARPKPRIRIKAEWNKIDTPAPVAATVVAKQPLAEVNPQTRQPARIETPSWKSSWLDWSEEQTAVKAASKKPVMTHISTTATRAEEPVLETKFSQSLNEIKEKYAATILKAKTKAGEWQRFRPVAIIAMLSIPVMCFGVWLGHKWTANDEAGKVVYAKTTPAVTPAVIGGETTAADNVKDNNAVPGKPQKAAANDSKEMIPSFDDGNKDEAAGAGEEPRSRQPAAKNGELHKKLPVQQTYAPVKNQPAIVKRQNSAQPAIAATPTEPRQQYTFTQPGNTSPAARTKTINPVLLANKGGDENGNGKVKSAEQPVARKNTEEANPVFQHTGNEAKIEDFVNVDADQPYTQNVQNLKLNVQNVADIALDLVVIDVEYFDAAGRFKNGQTIHIKNIPAGEAINVKIPDNAAAAKIKYKVSLVSAEQKGVYLIGE